MGVEESGGVSDISTFLRTGRVLIKHSRFGRKVRLLWSTADFANLCWASANYLERANGDGQPEFRSSGHDMAVIDHLHKMGLCYQIQCKRITRITRGNSKGCTTGKSRDCKFVIWRDRGEPLRFQAKDEKEREQWVHALLWLKEKNNPVGTPFNVTHVFSVDSDFTWSSSVSSETLEEQFQLYRLLGHGAFGAVYHAIHKASRLELAIKQVLVDPRFMTSEEIKAEVDVLKQCQHSNIVNYYGCWGPDRYNRLWILMELSSGGSVIDTMVKHNASLNEQQISYVCFSILKALIYLHESKNIIHRDVKGRNILIGQSGDIKLTDFGVSKRIVSDSSSDEGRWFQSRSQAAGAAGTNGFPSEHAGSPHWMAPEVIRTKQHTFKSDIWSLGITAIELAQGDPPFHEMNGFQVMDHILNSEPPRLGCEQNFSPLFHDFLSKCLVWKERDRPSASLLLQHPFINTPANFTPGAAETVMATLIYRQIYEEDQQDKRTRPGSSFFRKARAKKDRKSFEKVAHQQDKHSSSLLANDKSEDLLACYDIMLAECSKEQERKAWAEECLLRTRPKFECEVARIERDELQKKTGHTLYKISSKLFSTTDIHFVERVTVYRRFQDFLWLQKYFTRSCKYHTVPPLPEKNYRNRFNREFLATRRRYIQRFMDYISSHSWLTEGETLAKFLTSTKEDWTQVMNKSGKEKSETPPEAPSPRHHHIARLSSAEISKHEQFRQEMQYYFSKLSQCYEHVLQTAQALSAAEMNASKTWLGLSDTLLVNYEQNLVEAKQEAEGVERLEHGSIWVSSALDPLHLLLQQFQAISLLLHHQSNQTYKMFAEPLDFQRRLIQATLSNCSKSPQEVAQALKGAQKRYAMANERQTVLDAKGKPVSSTAAESMQQIQSELEKRELDYQNMCETLASDVARSFDDRRTEIQGIVQTYAQAQVENASRATEMWESLLKKLQNTP